MISSQTNVTKVPEEGMHVIVTTSSMVKFNCTSSFLSSVTGLFLLFDFPDGLYVDLFELLDHFHNFYPLVMVFSSQVSFDPERMARVGNSNQIGAFFNKSLFSENLQIIDCPSFTSTKSKEIPGSDIQVCSVEISLNFPVHQRYHAASTNGGSANNVVHIPNLFATLTPEAKFDGHSPFPADSSCVPLVPNHLPWPYSPQSVASTEDIFADSQFYRIQDRCMAADVLDCKSLQLSMPRGRLSDSGQVRLVTDITVWLATAAIVATLFIKLWGGR